MKKYQGSKPWLKDLQKKTKWKNIMASCLYYKIL